MPFYFFIVLSFTNPGGVFPERQQIDHLFVAMLGVGDETARQGIDHEIEPFQRDLANQDRTVIRNLGPCPSAFSSQTSLSRHWPSQAHYSRFVPPGLRRI